MFYLRRFLPFLTLLFCFNSSFCGERLTLGVSSNFLATMKILKKEFEKTHTTRISLVSGPTGLLYAQIKRGSPIDIFLSADEKRPRLLEADGLIHPDGLFNYALGQLVIVRKKGSTLSLKLNELKKDSSGLRFFSIANPKTAPFGKAGAEVLKNYGLYEELQSKGKLVQGENIGKAFQYVSMGHADLGIVSRSFVLDGRMGSRIGSFSEVNPTLYKPIKQFGVVLKGKMRKEVEAFLNFLKSKKAKFIISGMGYGLPKVKVSQL